MSKSILERLAPCDALDFTIRKHEIGKDASKILAVFMAAHPVLKQFSGRAQFQCYSPWKADADALAAQRYQSTAQLLPPGAAGSHDLILITPHHSRNETVALFAASWELLKEGGTVVVSMGNDFGAKRFSEYLFELFGNVETQSKVKCRVFWSRKDSSLVNKQLLAEFHAAGAPKTIPGTTLQAAPGCFSSEHIDRGSMVLAEHLPEGFSGSAADFGAGYGFLSSALLARSPQLKSIDLYEADARALALAELNLKSEKAKYVWSDLRQGIKSKTSQPPSYDLIIMNPPFHEQGRLNVQLGKQCVTAAMEALAPNGRLLFVANDGLPYLRELEAAVNAGKTGISGSFALERLGVRDGFVVTQISRSK